MSKNLAIVVIDKCTKCPHVYWFTMPRIEHSHTFANHRMCICSLTKQAASKERIPSHCPKIFKNV